MIDGTEDREAVFKAAMVLASQGSWGGCRLSEIAELAGVAPGELERVYSDKTALLVDFATFLDGASEASLDTALPDPDIPVRERLMEVLLHRFDVMEPYQAGIAALLRRVPTDPALVLGGYRSARRSMAQTLTAVGLSPFGLAGGLRQSGLMLVFLDCLKVWVDEADRGLPATMRRLDERLRLAENLVVSLASASGCGTIGPATG